MAAISPPTLFCHSANSFSMSSSALDTADSSFLSVAAADFAGAAFLFFLEAAAEVTFFLPATFSELFFSSPLLVSSSSSGLSSPPSSFLSTSMVSSNSFISSSASFLALRIAIASSSSSREAIAFSTCSLVTASDAAFDASPPDVEAPPSFIFASPSASTSPSSLVFTPRIPRRPSLVKTSGRLSPAESSADVTLSPPFCLVASSSWSPALNLPLSMTKKSRWRFCFALTRMFSSIECSVTSRYICTSRVCPIR